MWHILLLHQCLKWLLNQVSAEKMIKLQQSYSMQWRNIEIKTTHNLSVSDGMWKTPRSNSQISMLLFYFLQLTYYWNYVFIRRKLCVLVILRIHMLQKYLKSSTALRYIKKEFTLNLIYNFSCSVEYYAMWF